MRPALTVLLPAGGCFAAVFGGLAGGGIVALAGLAGLAVGVTILLAPLVGVLLTILAHMIWLVGAYAPAGINALSPSKIFTMLTLGSGVVWMLRCGVAPTFAPHMVPLAGYGLVVALAPMLTPAFEDSTVGIAKHVMMFLPYLLVANLAISRQGLFVALFGLSAICTLGAVIAILEVVFPGVGLKLGAVGFGAHVDESSLKSVTIKRVTGGMGDANWFSYTMGAAIPLNLIWWRCSKGVPMKIVAVSFAGLQLVGLVLSYTRTPLVGLFVVVLFLVIKKRLPLIPLVAGGILMAVSAPVWMPAGFAERIFSLSYLRSGSTEIRKEITFTALRGIWERPIVGHGYQRYGPYFMERAYSAEGKEMARRADIGEEPAELLRAHNLYLDIWFAYGLVGLVPFLLFCALLIRELFQIEARGSPIYADVAIVLLGSLISFLLSGMGGHAQELKVFWILAGIIAALRRVVFEDPAKVAARAR